MKVCVVGSGGREHALAVALARTAEVVVCPGNAGMAALGVACVAGPPEAVDADLFVIGPEAPLVDGLADRLRAGGRLVFGPGADGARLEGSKAWMKQLLADAGVPSAAYGAFSEVEPAVAFLRSLPAPWVVKTDGLAAGKGVLVTSDRDRAEADVVAKLSGQAFGDAGRSVVIEEGLTGPELSLMAVCDGRVAVPLAPAQDFKRIGDGDTGPNTGGMGAYSPVPGVDDAVVAEVMAKAVSPTLDALAARGIDFRGVLYAGLMLTAAGPRVLEFNVRFGDPETQVVLPRWQGDVAGVLAAAAAGRLDTVEAPTFSPDPAVCVVLAAHGYPESPRTGDPVEGVSRFGSGSVDPSPARLYCAGVAAGGPTGLVTGGGRVIGVGATGPTLSAARRRAYDAVPAISWAGMQYRSDIAASAAAAEK
ncbi:MAG TPA: phosphoribosylamine--glycine ligase [Acidimicrobiales bacterium]|nr:phosphoribosylamine--glycine ligase [Acidimicrobiales bacterium]